MDLHNYLYKKKRPTGLFFLWRWADYSPRLTRLNTVYKSLIFIYLSPFKFTTIYLDLSVIVFNFVFRN